MKENSFNSYLVLFMLIAQAGFPFFVGNTWLLIFFSITSFIFILQRHTFNNYILWFLSAFTILMVLQIIFLGNFDAGPFFGILLRIVYAYMAIKIIGIKFMQYYVKLLYNLTIIAMVLWFILAFIPGSYNALANFSHNHVQPLELFPEHVRDNIIIYTNDYWLLDKFPRNAGAFWEPGAFGAFLIVGLIFQTILSQTLLNHKNYFFFAALLTTFSLGSFFSFLFFIYAYLFLIKKVNFVTLFTSILILWVAYYAYNKFDFLSQKLETRVEKSLQIDDNLNYKNLNYQVGRNEQAILDLRSFINSPIIGEGQFIEYEYGASASGLTEILRKWGLVGFLLIFVTMFQSFRRYSKIKQINPNYAWVALIGLSSVALSQSLYGKPIFLGFIFMFLIFNKNDLFKSNTFNRIIDDKK